MLYPLVQREDVEPLRQGECECECERDTRQTKNNTKPKLPSLPPTAGNEKWERREKMKERKKESKLKKRRGKRKRKHNHTQPLSQITLKY